MESFLKAIFWSVVAGLIPLAWHNRRRLFAWHVRDAMCPHCGTTTPQVKHGFSDDEPMWAGQACRCAGCVCSGCETIIDPDAPCDEAGGQSG